MNRPVVIMSAPGMPGMRGMLGAGGVVGAVIVNGDAATGTGRTVGRIPQYFC